MAFRPEAFPSPPAAVPDPSESTFYNGAPALATAAPWKVFTERHRRTPTPALRMSRVNQTHKKQGVRKRKRTKGRERVVAAVASVISRLEAEQAAFHYGELSGENISSTMKECIGFCCVRNKSFKGGCAAHGASFCLLPVDNKFNLWPLRNKFFVPVLNRKKN